MSPSAAKQRTGKPRSARSQESYDRLVQSADICDIRLVASQSALRPQFVEQLTSKDHLNVRTAYRFQVSDESILTCGVRFDFTLGDDDQEKAVVFIRADYELEYRFPDELDLDTEAAKQFASNNAVFNAWPFFREFAFSMVSRMSLPPLVTPLYRLPPRPM